MVVQKNGIPRKKPMKSGGYFALTEFVCTNQWANQYHRSTGSTDYTSEHSTDCKDNGVELRRPNQGAFQYDATCNCIERK